MGGLIPAGEGRSSRGGLITVVSTPYRTVWHMVARAFLAFMFLLLCWLDSKPVHPSWLCTLASREDKTQVEPLQANR